MKAVCVKGMTLVNEDDPIRELNLKGAISVIDFDNDNFLKTMYGLIETNIVEAVDLPTLGLTMWLDEEGKLKNNVLPNLDGTFLYRHEYKVPDIIMGHIVFTSNRTDDEGWVLGLEDEHIKRLETLILGMQESRPEKAFSAEVL